MARFNPVRDQNPSQIGGRSLHTYTPRSHEDLLRSHLQLDASRNARLQQELQKLADENRKLKRDLDNAQNDLKDKDKDIANLRDRLAKKENLPTGRDRDEPHYDPNKVFELDGKPVTLEEIIRHFEGVIEKHHDLLNRKNQRIQELEDLLRNRPQKISSPTRNAETQSHVPNNNQDLSDFAKELALIRKEYEQVEHILTDRNNKLERMIEDLQRKLDQYSDEIEHLRRELAAREGQPNDNLQRLILEKEKENEYLRDIINSLKNNRPVTNTYIQSPNEDLEKEIRRIIQDKKNAVDKLNNMISDIKHTPSENAQGSPDLSSLEKECQGMIDDLNNMNDKLNNLIMKIKQSPSGVPVEPVNKDELLINLRVLKRQCEDEIEALKNQLATPGATDTGETPVIFTGQAQVRIDDPDFLRRRSRPRSPESDGDEPINIPSNIKFILYPSQGSTREDQPRVSPLRPREVQPSHQLVHPPSISPEDSVGTFKNVELKSITPTEVSYRYSIPEPVEKPRHRLYPEIPSETASYQPRHYHPVECEACQDDYIPETLPRQHIIVKEKDKAKPIPKTEPKLEPKHKPEHKKEKKPKKGCCGGKSSDTSTAPYTKEHKEEKVTKIHSPDSQHKSLKSTTSTKIPERRTPVTTPEGTPRAKKKVISDLYPLRIN